MSHGDYPEQLTYLIFLKTADEYGKPSHSRDVGIPAGFNWQRLNWNVDSTRAPSFSKRSRRVPTWAAHTRSFGPSGEALASERERQRPTTPETGWTGNVCNWCGQSQR